MEQSRERPAEGFWQGDEGSRDVAGLAVKPNLPAGCSASPNTTPSLLCSTIAARKMTPMRKRRRRRRKRKSPTFPRTRTSARATPATPAWWMAGAAPRPPPSELNQHGAHNYCPTCSPYGSPFYIRTADMVRNGGERVTYTPACYKEMGPPINMATLQSYPVSRHGLLRESFPNPRAISTEV